MKKIVLFTLLSCAFFMLEARMAKASKMHQRAGQERVLIVSKKQ